VLQDYYLDTTESILFVTLPDGDNDIPDGVHLLWWSGETGELGPLGGNAFYFSELNNSIKVSVSFT